jgi:hypothetical protein
VEGDEKALNIVKLRYHKISHHDVMPTWMEATSVQLDFDILLPLHERAD